MARFTHHPLIASIILLLLFSNCESKLLKHQAKASSPQHKFFPFGMPTTMVFFSDVKQKKLEKYDPKNLNQTSKQVDEFIRKQANLSDIELTAAKGNGQRFVYTYENKSEYKNQTYVFTVQAVNEQEQQGDVQTKTQTAKHGQAQSSYVYVEPVNVVRQSPMVYVEPVPAHKQNQVTTSSTTTAPTTSTTVSTNKEKPKYRIVGINYVVSSKPTEEQKKKMAEQKKEYVQKMKKFNEKWEKLKKEQDKQLSEINNIFGDDDDFWWHK